MKPYKSPFVKIAFWIFCLMIALMLREIVRAEKVESDGMKYEALQSPTTENNIEVEQQVEQVQEIITTQAQATEVYTITAYCSCSICCGEWATKRGDGPVIGAYGVELTPWYSVAAPLPYGTKLKIDGMTYEVQDTTASWIVDRYAGRIIDIYVGNSHQEAINFGKQELEVTVVNDDGNSN